MLGQIDAELVSRTKKTIITDDVSLAKVISYSTSKGSVTTSIVYRTRIVNLETISEFIDVEEAYRRIVKFTTTDEFWNLSKEDQMNVIAFKLVKEMPESDSTFDNRIAEDVIVKVLEEMKG